MTKAESEMSIAFSRENSLDYQISNQIAMMTAHDDHVAIGLQIQHKPLNERDWKRETRNWLR